MQYKVIVEDAARGFMGGIAHSENRQENPFLLQAMINRSPIPAGDAEAVPSPAPPEA